MALDPRIAQTNASMRIAFRVVGAILLIAGIVLLVIGIKHFSNGFSSTQSLDSPSANSDTGPGSILMLAGGGFLAMFGVAALRMGFLRAEVNYLAGEASGAIRSIASDVAEGVRSADKAGPYCAKCGVRNDVDARFCDGCGAALSTSP